MTRDIARLQSLSTRIVSAAESRAIEPNRLRRTVAFHRLMARLEGSGWVLKGGFCLEVRMPGVARATKDVDLVREGQVADGDELVDDLEGLLARSAIDDGFSFWPTAARPVRPTDTMASAWRVRVEARVDGQLFDTLVLDIVEQFAEVAGALDELVMRPPLPGVGHQAVRVVAVDVYQHAAEKLHAMGRLYAGDRVSSRVKDLVDLALLIEAGVLTDTARLATRLEVVYALRDGLDELPSAMPSPPKDWTARYAALASDLGLNAKTSAQAYSLVAALYAQAHRQGGSV